MKTPIQEQEWQLRPNTPAMDSGMPYAVYGPSGIVARVVFLDEAHAVVSTPAMARALLRHLGPCSNTGSRTRGCRAAGITHMCAACETLDVLKAAGVLP